MSNNAEIIKSGKTLIGIEFGSTRIKAVLTDLNADPLASGSFNWENTYKDGVWTYGQEEFIPGLQTAFANLKKNVKDKYDVTLTTATAMGISGMMHGYLPFDKDGNQIAEFRTWRNTITEKAAEILSDKFNFNIPQRWSIAHLYQAMLNNESHINNIASIYTLASYMHFLLTGKRVVGIGEASGMFPVDAETSDYDKNMIEIFREISKDTSWDIYDILPKVMVAGESAGSLTKAGAAILDPTGEFKAGVPFCPPEGDAATGMVATNSVAVGTGNISAGTSVFLMAVLDKPLSKGYKEIDVVATPSGTPVAMIHSNNGCGDIDSWADLFVSMFGAFGNEISPYQILDKLYELSLTGDKDCGGLMNYNYLAGEVITDVAKGAPLFMRRPDSHFTLANFAKALIYSITAPLAVGKEILDKEGISINRLLGHGGFFKAPKAGPTAMAAALNSPVSVMGTAGEGGPWGMAILAGYMAAVSTSRYDSLSDYLQSVVFSQFSVTSVIPTRESVESFKAFLEVYKRNLEAMNKIDM